MGLLDKIMFWKKEEDFDFDKIAEKDMSTNPFTQQLPSDQQGLNDSDLFTEPHQNSQFNMPQRSTFSAPSQQPNSFSPSYTGAKDRDLELINSKLDTIKAMLNSIDQKMSNLEKGGQKPPQRLW